MTMQESRPIQIYVLGRFDIVLEGTPLRFVSKTPRKVLAVLKGLLCAGRRGVSQGTLQDALWPESESLLARRALNTSVYRLRRLLRSKEAVALNDGWGAGPAAGESLLRRRSEPGLWQTGSPSPLARRPLNTSVLSPAPSSAQATSRSHPLGRAGPAADAVDPGMIQGASPMADGGRSREFALSSRSVSAPCQSTQPLWQAEPVFHVEHGDLARRRGSKEPRR